MHKTSFIWQTHFSTIVENRLMYDIGISDWGAIYPICSNSTYDQNPTIRTKPYVIPKLFIATDHKEPLLW